MKTKDHLSTGQVSAELSLSRVRIFIYIAWGARKDERVARAKGDEVMAYYHCGKKQAFLLAFNHVRRCLRTEAQIGGKTEKLTERVAELEHELEHVWKPAAKMNEAYARGFEQELKELKARAN